MHVEPLLAASTLTVSAGIVSALVTAWAIAYARRRNLIDHPGQRRSHRVPTPRGGGIGIVVATLSCLCAPVLLTGIGLPLFPVAAFTFALMVVAAIGWYDDHHALSAAARFAVHTAAALIVLLPAWSEIGEVIAMRSSGAHALGIIAAIIVVAVIAMVWSINLHNFMDGLDGLLAMQAIFVLVSLATLCLWRGHPVLAWPMAIVVAAVLGFLPFNFPHARVFMGDVGSGALGFLIAIACCWQIADSGTALASGVIASSAFVTDTTLTLLLRFARGRRWYSAHREHLYQWLLRCGRSHAQIVAMYLAWNLLVVVPVLVWINRDANRMNSDSISTAGPTGIVGMLAIYALATVVWCVGKRQCLRLIRNRRHHAAA
ncbi:MAG: glycosyltransferase family 4 protein [Dokdonella sp.]